MNLLVLFLLQVSSLILFGSGRDLLTSRIALVSKDGRDLVILSKQQRVIFIRDFERICRGETTFERAGLVLGLRPEDICQSLGFEHGRVCVATVRISQALWSPVFILVCRCKGSIFSPSDLIFRRRLRSCGPLKTPGKGCVQPVACSSRTVAYILRGGIPHAGKIFRCSRTQKMLRNFHHRQHHHFWNSKSWGHLVGTPSQNRCYQVLTLTFCVHFVVRPV